MASLFRSLGLTFQDVGFIKFNMGFPPMAAAAHLGATWWAKSSMAVAAMDMLPVPPAKVPYFVVAVMPVIAVVCAVTTIMGITIYSPKGYESQHSRSQKAPGNLAAKGLPAWLDRVQGAQYNTFEACICMLCSFFVATNVGFPPILFAKMATLFLFLRLAYPIVYALDIDIVRTQLWFTGLYVLLLISFGALFPDTVLPMLGEAVAVGKKK